MTNISVDHYKDDGKPVAFMLRKALFVKAGDDNVVTFQGEGHGQVSYTPNVWKEWSTKWTQDRDNVIWFYAGDRVTLTFNPEEKYL